MMHAAQKLLHKLLFLFLFFFSVLVLLSAPVSASSVLFEDDFDSGDVGKWSVPRNDCLPDVWKFVGGKYGISINHPGGCVTESVPDDAFWDNSWNDYIIELDMDFVSGTDKNIAWRYTSRSDWVDLHFIGDSVVFQRATLIQSDNIQPFSNGETYHFRIEVLDNNFKVYYYNVLDPSNISFLEGVDLSNSYPTGKPALQASAGADFRSQVWFDNYKVTSIDEGLDVPYSSQVDPLWVDEQYDSLDATIGEVGCALSAATMTLNYHGITFLPNGLPLNVANLNAWLNENPDGYWREGLTSWTALTRLSRLMNERHSDWTVLDYKKIAPPDFNEIDRILVDEEDPLVFEEIQQESPSGVHFVTANGVVNSGAEYSILDPFEATRSSMLMPPDELVSARYLYPTNTNLSYLVLHADDGLNAMITNPVSERLGNDGEGNSFDEIAEGLFGLDKPLMFEDDPGKTTGKQFWEHLIADPVSGEYTIEFSAMETGWYEFELYVYDKQANIEVFKERIYVIAGQPVAHQLDYNQDGGVDFAKVNKQVSFKSLRDLVWALHRQGEIVSKPRTYALDTIVRMAKKFYPRRTKTTNRLLKKFEKKVKRYYPKHMTKLARDLLLEEVRLLKASL